MKTETELQVAKEYLKQRDLESEGSDRWLFWNKVCNVHNEDSQRFLEFLEDLVNWIDKNKKINDLYADLEQKITDLKQAIKEYEEAGI